MRGPLGIHRLSGRRYPFVDPVSLKPVSAATLGSLTYLETMERITPLRAAEVLATLLDEARPHPALALAEASGMAPTKAPKLEQSPIERIKGNISDLYAFISKYVELDEHGRGHCPFHPPDVHPSFAVNRQRGYWADFHVVNPRTGRYEGGDVIEFYRRLHGLSYKEAVRELLAMIEGT